MEELGIRLSEDQVMKISLIKFKDNVQTNIKSVVRKSFEEKRGRKTAALNLETFNHSSYVLKTYKQRWNSNFIQVNDQENWCQEEPGVLIQK